jgi:hyperosmotically inducible protein
MTMTKRSNRAAVLTAALAAALLGLPQISLAAGTGMGAHSFAADDGGAQADVQAKLNKSQFKDVKVEVQNGLATLSGTVSLYEYKVDADKRVHKVKGVNAVRNDIQVAGPTVSDQELKQKLGERLAYDRVGYDVNNGVVTLGGHARTDVDKDSALALVSTYPGVKEVDNDIQVDPVSMMDDQTRMAVARAIYGYPMLNKYAIDPAKTIRISVQNGHVELYGVVDDQADKNVAFMRANAVPGVFSVKNYLQVANQAPEKPKQSAMNQ